MTTSRHFIMHSNSAMERYVMKRWVGLRSNDRINQDSLAMEDPSYSECLFDGNCGILSRLASNHVRLELVLGELGRGSHPVVGVDRDTELDKERLNLYTQNIFYYSGNN